jgi:UDP-N-acetylmuramoyl-L-alanyl-D-glutamate--2,6-diaminopimelate ligase
MAAERGVALATLLRRLSGASAGGGLDRHVTAIETDSRVVTPGALFVALRGTAVDSHRYVPEAIARGAAAVVVEPSYDGELPDGAAVVRVADTRRALSHLAAAFYGDPSFALDTVGITGTNGKTTTAHMIAAIAHASGKACGVIGTVGASLGERRWDLANTTPLPPELHALLAEMRDAGAAAVAMEVSSHALALERVEDVRFRVGVLTNVTRDHLDFHENWEAYAASKRRLFDLAEYCVLNADDPCGARWIAELRACGRTAIAYGEAGDASLVPGQVQAGAFGSQFVVCGQPVELRVPGRFNVWNALAAIAAARVLGIDDATSARGLAALERVPGRMERIAGGDVNVVVDYAHTPDALESALRSLRETSPGAVAVVFGCGGDRDAGKRAPMGSVAARLADRIYLTSDNPRSEEPRAIAGGIAAGIGACAYVLELDRRSAIERAIREARPGDTVLVAGKGHETYQIVGTQRLPFDDAAVAREALAARGAAG